MRRTNNGLLPSIAAGVRLRRGLSVGLPCILFVVGVSHSAQTPASTPHNSGAERALASSGTPGLDGRWWAIISAEERSGYVNGFEDCYVYDAKGIHTATGWTAQQYVQAVSERYDRQPDQRKMLVSEVLKEINRTGKSRPVHKGGEEWKEKHGYYDGLWWRGASADGQLGFIEGYLSCYSTEMAGASPVFLKAARDYVSLMDSYMGSHAHSDEERLADILSRFGDRGAK